MNTISIASESTFGTTSARPVAVTADPVKIGDRTSDHGQDDARSSDRRLGKDRKGRESRELRERGGQREQDADHRQ